MVKLCLQRSLCVIAAALGGSHERRLLNDLSLNYNKLERPVAEESEALEIRWTGDTHMAHVLWLSFFLPVKITQRDMQLQLLSANLTYL